MVDTKDMIDKCMNMCKESIEMAMQEKIKVILPTILAINGKGQSQLIVKQEGWENRDVKYEYMEHIGMELARSNFLPFVAGFIGEAWMSEATSDGKPKGGRSEVCLVSAMTVDKKCACSIAQMFRGPENEIRLAEWSTPEGKIECNLIESLFFGVAKEVKEQGLWKR